MNYFFILGIILPFLGTTIGSSFVFFLKDKINPKIDKILLGFAGGVMVAASIWSLILPALDYSDKYGKLNFLPVTIGIIIGFLFLFIMDKITSKKNQNKSLLYLAITIHNIPEGMAVGAGFITYYLTGNLNFLISGFILSLGISIQNIPEGTIISLPLKLQGYTKTKSFLYGMASGIIEPIFAILTIVLSKYLMPILPVLMSFAAGAMLYVVVEEIIPNENDFKSHLKTFGFMFGFLVMMILDIVL